MRPLEAMGRQELLDEIVRLREELEAIRLKALQSTSAAPLTSAYEPSSPLTQLIDRIRHRVPGETAPPEQRCYRCHGRAILSNGCQWPGLVACPDCDGDGLRRRR